MNYKIISKTIIGTRKQQQDKMYHSKSNQLAFAVICDGMGEISSDEVPSEAAVNTIIDLYNSKPKSQSYPQFYYNSIEKLDESVIEFQKRTGCLMAGTTFSSVCIEKDKLFWLSIGDTRIYIIRENEIVQITNDHNVKWLIENFDCSDNEELTNTSRPDALVSFLGLDGIEHFDLNTTPFTLQNNDKIFITSDGITKVLDDQSIYQILTGSSFENSLNNLFEIATQFSFGSQDNTTCILISIENS